MKTFDGYKKQALTDSYVLLAGGGHKEESSLSVNYAASAGNATSAGSVDWSGVANKPTSLPANGGNADTARDATLHNGYTIVQTNGLTSTIRDFTLGTLVRTSIDYSATEGDSFYVEIKGNTYYGGPNSCFTQIQGYIYEDTIVAYGVTHLGVLKITPITAMNIDGKLCFWFPRLGYWMGFDIRCYRGTNYAINTVTSIEDSADPGGTKRVTLTENEITSYHNGNLTSSVIGGLGTLSNNISGNAASASSVDWSGVTNRPTNVSAFYNDKGYLTSHAYSYGSIDIYDINGAKKTSNNTVSASVNTETLRLQEGANIAITATNSGDSGSDSIKIAVTGITSNIDRNGYGQLALWYNGASKVSATLQSSTFEETLTVKAGSGIDFSGVNSTDNNDIWTISAIPYNCAITLNNNSAKSLIKDSWSADKDSVYLTSNGTASGTSLAAGTYALWIEDRSSDSGTPNYYSGTFTCAGSATAGRLDEIALHSSMATNADTNAPTRIFVATQISDTPGKHVLRFCSLDSKATPHYLTVKVNRII